MLVQGQDRARTLHGRSHLKFESRIQKIGGQVCQRESSLIGALGPYKRLVQLVLVGTTII